MKIKIPGHVPVTIYSDTNTYIEIPGDGPVEIFETPSVAAAGISYAIITSIAGDYVMVDTTNYVVTQV